MEVRRGVSVARWCAIVAAVVLVLLLGRGAHAATRPVTNTLDSGAGSLRSQIAAAAAGDTITFIVTGVITLTTGEIGITHSLTINGPGPQVLAVSGNHASGVFSMTAGSAVQISGLTFKNGNNTATNGGAMTTMAR